MSRVFLFGLASVEADAFLSCEDDESVSSQSSDEGDACLSSEVDAPSGESRPREQDGNSHECALDDHFGGKSSCGVEGFVVS